jgi:hypothetical protein
MKTRCVSFVEKPLTGTTIFRCVRNPAQAPKDPAAAAGVNVDDDDDEP